MVSSTGGANQSVIKVVVLGPGSVGKSCLTLQLVSSQFIAEYDPTIEDSYRKQVSVDEEVCCLDILDTAGQEEYGAMRHQYMAAGQGFLLVYDITQRKSFDEMAELHTQVLRATDQEAVPCVLVGNKTDLEERREVPAEEGKNLAAKLGVRFVETSARKRVNVEEAFFEVVRAFRVMMKEEGGGGGGGAGGAKKERKKKSTGGGGGGMIRKCILF